MMHLRFPPAAVPFLQIRFRSGRGIVYFERHSSSRERRDRTEVVSRDMKSDVT